MGLSFEQVQAARERQAPFVRRTPIERSSDLSALLGREVYLKLENLQHTGAFKLRGAISRLLTMALAERVTGVLTASAGNHGQGVALAAKLLGMPATVVLPVGAPLAKIAAIQRHGAEVLLEGSAYDSAHTYALELARERGQTYIHAFEDPEVMAGQGAVALEALEDVPDLDTLIIPVGGGGLIAGMSIAARGTKPAVKIVGVQAEGSSALADAFRSGELNVGDASTIADGIAVKVPSPHTFSVIQRTVDDMVTVSDEAIARTIVLLLERHKLLAEGAGAAALAALVEGVVSAQLAPAAANVCAVISGGNIDPLLLGKVLQHGMASAGRYLALRTWLEDRPGQLLELTQVLAAERINILHVGIHRLGPYTSLGRVGLDLIVETRDRAHAESVLELIRRRGYPAEEALDLVPPEHTSDRLKSRHAADDPR
jgi:threonine dehydratase